MEDRRAGGDRRTNQRPTASERRGPTPASAGVRWQALVPMVVLAAASIVSWRYSQAAAIEDEVLEPIAYPVELRTPLLSARRVPETMQQPLADAALAPELSAILAGSGPAACLIVEEDDRILASTNASTSLVPASNQKIISTHAALSQFGPERRFTTTVAAGAPVTDGRVQGNLHLIGGGDPFLATDDWRAQYGDEQDGRAFTRLEDLADAVVEAGVVEVTGSVVGDESLFDVERYGPWADRLIASNQSGPLSALSVNEGFSSWPAEFAGSFRARTPATNPALNAAEVFARLLGERGVVVLGASQVSPAPVERVELASIQSPPLVDIVTHINSYSNNYGAEILVKHLGRSERGIGSTAAGIVEIRSILELQRLNLAGVRLEDGSGLAETNRVTCSLLAEVLERTGPGSPLVASLSIGGERGSLAIRHDGTPADGRVFAKTGTLNGVTALSGVVESATQDDVALVFTYIVNGESVGLNEELRALQEPFIEALAAYPNAPSLTALGPLQP